MLRHRKLAQHFGAGVVTGASDDDPSGIATYSQAGAQYGFGLLWLAIVTTPMMIAVQEMSARIATVTGRGFTEVLKRTSGKQVVLVLTMLLFVVNAVNIGADLSAMAAAAQLIVPGPTLLYLVLFTALTIVLEVTVRYRRYVWILRWLTLVLLAYVVAALFIRYDLLEVLRSIVLPAVPLGDPGVWMMIVAILGTTISPYLVYWQAAEEVEDTTAAQRRSRRQPNVMRRMLRTMRTDVATGMIYSNVIMFFIILATAGTLHRAGILHIETAAQAAEALRPFAADATFFLFTLGIIGTGLLAIPILAGSASFALAEVFDRPEGLERRVRQAPFFYTTIAAAIAAGFTMNLIGVSPVKFLIFAAVLNGLLAPVILWFLLRTADRPDVVGPHRTPAFLRAVGWITFATMAVAGLLLIGSIAFRGVP